ncbi:hypothetical protein OK348_10875 [Flavobacterium sp. MXW15]|uniref:Uncharacterized protein n=1 Tax=Xanthomonas chitinilytica TaxID=2989819 RepID=A0ABT3JXA7_9XANT|nr:hypothetical protein [Xanthomonas sp. H13-6]MCW4455295.1 hypothetical protein [Flavobacterium sp. MXW15]MCW4473122.1 hypothetical protein [Xanthomonas sp. H13-6]
MSKDRNAPDSASSCRRDVLHDLQLLRDVSIINARTVRELGPLPPEGLPVQEKRKPDLPRPAQPSPQEVAMTTDDHSQLGMQKSEPPIPEGLREMLKDYPEHLQTLQKDLNRVVSNPLKGTPVLEQAIWALEGALETFIFEAQDELKLAEASGDVERVARAKEKDILMFHASSYGNWKSKNLLDYFEFPAIGASHGK